ncbi:MAG: FAD-dependent oxidoreductase [Acidobacteriota bacterium]|nr:FAD-dependent oxidoreductase [Acidobacteriota bacterium]
MKQLQTDILIVGGGLGGCAAALAAAESGLSVVLTEESDWVGGQLTSQATPPDEHGWIEEFGCTRSYRQMRNAVREHYKKFYPLTEEARSNTVLNPGDGWVSPLCAEPKVFLKVLEAKLAEYIQKGNLQVLTEHFPVAADMENNRVRRVTLVNLQNGEHITISAKHFIDATELGELLPLTGTEFVTGAESKAETGEPNAKETAEPNNSQAFSACFAMSFHDGENHTIEKPEKYEFWRDFVPDLNPAWSGKLLSLGGISPRTMQPITYNFAPHREPNKAFAGLWTYRRILHRKNFVEGAFDSDITLVNYPQIDYFLKNLSGAADYREKQRLISEAKKLSLSFLYWMQTEAGFAGLKLRNDVVGTSDGLAKMPYIRESRRIRAEFTIIEQHVSAACRPRQIFAEKFDDSVGIGFYRIDLHPTVGGDNFIDVEALPFQIPLGALLPQKTENLLAACKNIGTTHITNGCYRLHPVEWNIGEAAGNLAAFCLRKSAKPSEIRNDRKLLREFQDVLVKNGVELEWRTDLNLVEGDTHRHAS